MSLIGLAAFLRSCQNFQGTSEENQTGHSESQIAEFLATAAFIHVRPDASVLEPKPNTEAELSQPNLTRERENTTETGKMPVTVAVIEWKHSTTLGLLLDAHRSKLHTREGVEDALFRFNKEYMRIPVYGSLRQV